LHTTKTHSRHCRHPDEHLMVFVIAPAQGDYL